MIRRLLVALDGSPRQPGVLVAATEIAERFGARMILFRAVTIPPEFPAAAHTALGDPLPEYARKKALAELEAAAQALPGALVEPPIVELGHPWRAILEVAERVKADLIVLGSHGYHGLDRLLGTTADKVVNHAHRNVLVVHTAYDAV